ncbi:MAG: YeeE/YedE family protein [Proteobacteria bacterium]|nr:YeeE/YedE family protein [Pseudomonadota bacterium]
MNAVAQTLQPAPVTRSGEAVRVVAYLLAGLYFGIVLIKGEVADWFRIQEMFRLQAFHMYGVIGSAIAVAMIGIWLLRRFEARAGNGQRVAVKLRPADKGQLYGGLLFGFGWALTGACPGPLFAEVGAGYSIVVVAIAACFAGTWLYAKLQGRLPH